LKVERDAPASKASRGRRLTFDFGPSTTSR